MTMKAQTDPVNRVSQGGTTSQASIPSQMRGLLLEEYNKSYAYHTDIPVPEIEPGLLLIRVKAAGFCHTDLMVMSGAYPATLPIVPGHETVGIVAAVAEGVTGFEVGERVGTLTFRGGCGRCRECIRLTPAYCSQIQLAGLNSYGGMAQYLLADPEFTIHLPPTLGWTKAAPLMCAGATMWNSFLSCGVLKGGLVGVVGIGGLGHLAVQFAKALGYVVVAIDTRAAPLELCDSFPEHLRPDMGFNPNKVTVGEMLDRIGQGFQEVVYPPTSERLGPEISEGGPTSEESDQSNSSSSHHLNPSTNRSPKSTTLPATGLAAVLICTDSLEGYATGLGLLAKHGTLVYIGQPKEPVPMHWSAFVTRDVKVVAGCLPSGYWRGGGTGMEGGGVGLAKGEDREKGNGRSEGMGGRWMSASDIMRDMIEVVERVGVHIEVTEYKLEDYRTMLEEFGGERMKGKVVLVVEDDGENIFGS